MSLRAKSVATLCRRAATAYGQRNAVQLPAAVQAQQRTVVTAATAAAGAAAGGTMMRVMGVEVPYGFVIGTGKLLSQYKLSQYNLVTIGQDVLKALVVGFGAYMYETLVLAKEGNTPLQAEMTRHPDIKSLKMTDHNGQPFTAQKLLGKWALIDFGSLDQPADVKTINNVCRTAEAAQQRCGVAITPVFLSLNPQHDKVDDLKRVVAAAGHPALVALTGDADGMLECANKFKSLQKAAVMTSEKGDEKYKHGDSAIEEAYVSSFVYLVTPSGQFAQLWPKEVPLALLSDAVCRAVKE